MHLEQFVQDDRIGMTVEQARASDVDLDGKAQVSVTHPVRLDSVPHGFRMQTKVSNVDA